MATDDKRYGPGNKNDSSPPPPPPPPPKDWSQNIPAPEPGAPLQPPVIPGTLGPPISEMTPGAPRGALRFAQDLNNAPGGRGTDVYDNYILSLKSDPSDTEYNYWIHYYQDKAKKDIVKRQAERDAQLASLRPTPPLTLAQALPEKPGANLVERNADVRAKKQAAWRPQTTAFVDVFGNPIDPDKVSLGNSMKPGGQADSIVNAGTDAAANYEHITDQQYIAGGGAVWVGDQTVTSSDGLFQAPQGQYRNAADMYNDPHKWNAAQTAAFQLRVGLDPTGVADQDTVAFWKWVVDSARAYTAQGQHRTVDSIVDMGSSQVKGRGGGGGGGGGGGAGAAIPADAAKRLLNQAMKTLAGREATTDELKAFLPAIRGAAGGGDFDPTQFTEDWVKGGSVSSEVGTFQAGTDYYSVIQQLIGGK